MGTTFTRRGFAGRSLTLAAGVALAAPFVRRAGAADPIRLRCSLDTAPSHVRNVSCADYLQKLEAASNGAIKTEIFHGGSLFADRDVAKALLQGQAEMAAPGSWVLAGFVPSCEMFHLPIMYAQPIEIAHKVIDGKPGQVLGAELQQKLRVHIIGNWIELGNHNWYSTKKPLNALTDLQGMKIRNSGGAAQAWRTRFFGAIPNTTAWPDTPLALSQGTFDGLITTNESINSAQLWDAGLKYALEDHQFIGEYIPMVSDAFWTKLPPDLQALMGHVWADNIGAYRANMAASQERAKGVIQSHGVTYVIPSADEIVAVRRRMLGEQDAMAREVKIPPALVQAVMAEIGSTA